MLSAYIDSKESAPPDLVEFKTRLNMFNVAQYALVRGGGILLVAWILLYSPAGLRTRSILMQAHAWTLLSLYAAFCAVYVFRQYSNIRARRLSRPPSPTHIPMELDGPAPRSMQLRIPTRPAIIVVPYGVLMGLGFAALVFTTLTIAPASKTESLLLSHALGITISLAIFCARMFSLVMEDGIRKFVAQPLRTFLRPGFWLHGGLFGAAVGTVIAYRAGYVPNFSIYAASLAIGLPLYETFSRLGCHTYGCCYGCPVDMINGVPSTRSHLLWRMLPYSPVTYNHPSDYAATRAEPKLLHQPLLPIQLISATAFFLLFAIVSLPLAVYVSPELAGVVTLAAHAAVRLLTETCRADFRGQINGSMSSTGKMAILQGFVGFAAVAYILFFENDFRAAHVANWSHVLNDGRLSASSLAVVVGTVVYGVHIEEIGRWVPENDFAPQPVQRSVDKK
ncbi:Phosphatidylglycerol--prolipo protein diacylglyceryl transferase [Favolaschia claudopus]|uniref:Phosphatidylglycerol--prolipo protein diacylglyceryl transferase n=1 Tax=Favolaschia claudopus TaxID=2862362 RepID=A0AAW0BJF8_9AGAR